MNMLTQSLLQLSILLLVFSASDTAGKENPQKHNHPLEYAALGDSYASGDGAGSSKLLPNFDALCGRFSEAYPVRIVESSEITVNSFRNLACGGAVTTTVLHTQVPFISNSDMATIQVGGNEVDFFVLLNECVQQWRPFSTCDTAMTKARKLVESASFLDRFSALVSGAMKTIKPGGDLLVLGYARFFNDRTDQCDHVSFSVTDPNNLLSKALRRKFNDMVMLLNDVIKAAAEAHGATYVDTDSVFEGHRFCEAGVIEPAPGASWFFVTAPDRREKYPSDRRTQQQLGLHDQVGGFTNLTRTFHPTSEGHKAIAREVLATL